MSEPNQFISSPLIKQIIINEIRKARSMNMLWIISPSIQAHHECHYNLIGDGGGMLPLIMLIYNELFKATTVYV